MWIPSSLNEFFHLSARYWALYTLSQSVISAYWDLSRLTGILPFNNSNVSNTHKYILLAKTKQNVPFLNMAFIRDCTPWICSFSLFSSYLTPYQCLVNNNTTNILNCIMCYNCFFSRNTHKNLINLEFPPDFKDDQLRHKDEH